MDSRKLVLQQTGLVALGEALCVAAILGLAALLGWYDRSVLLGGVVGGVLSVLNFFFMALFACMAGDKAVAQDVKGGKALIQISFLGRTVVMFLVLFAFVKSGLCNAVAAVLPLIFVRPILTIAEFFRKSGETNT